MDQTPAHEWHNPDLLKLIPVDANSIIEIGCSSGALAREFKKINPQCNYLGIEIDSTYASLAARYCDDTEVINLDEAGPDFYAKNANREAWLFGDTLEHFKNPWEVLKQIRKVIPANGSVLACIPNAQHWSVQARLSVGDFRYEESGLLDRTHLRWFTRKTIHELFEDTGFTLVERLSRIFDEPHREVFLQLIGDLAEVAGADPLEAMKDATPLQYVIKAIPKI